MFQDLAAARRAEPRGEREEYGRAELGARQERVVAGERARRRGGAEALFQSPSRVLWEVQRERGEERHVPPRVHVAAHDAALPHHDAVARRDQAKRRVEADWARADDSDARVVADGHR